MVRPFVKRYSIGKILTMAKQLLLLPLLPLLVLLLLQRPVLRFQRQVFLALQRPLLLPVQCRVKAAWPQQAQPLQRLRQWLPRAHCIMCK